MSKPEFVYITYIETTPEKLFQALTTANSRSVLVRHQNRTDWKVGSPFKW